MKTQRSGDRKPLDVPKVAVRRNERKPTVDAVDRAIIDVLRNDARITNRELAARVGLSPPACLRRLRRLERQRTIRRYTVEVGSEAEPGLVAYVGVRISEHIRTVLTEFESQVRSLESVSQVCQVTGQFDYLLRVEVDDLSGYRRFHTHELAAVPGVAQVTTFVVINEV